MSKAKGRRYERRAAAILEAAGYSVTIAAASLGAFDLVAIGATDVRLVQVKGGRLPYATPAEREAMALTPAPANCSREVWKFYHGRRGGPVIDYIAGACGRERGVPSTDD